jgi:hypothetical protein
VVVGQRDGCGLGCLDLRVGKQAAVRVDGGLDRLDAGLQLDVVGGDLVDRRDRLVYVALIQLDQGGLGADRVDQGGEMLGRLLDVELSDVWRLSSRKRTLKVSVPSFAVWLVTGLIGSPSRRGRTPDRGSRRSGRCRRRRAGRWCAASAWPDGHSASSELLTAPPRAPRRVKRGGVADRLGGGDASGSARRPGLRRRSRPQR